MFAYAKAANVDEDGRLRVNDKEIDPAVQARVARLWDKVSSENIYELTAFASYKTEFLVCSDSKSRK
ncbi:hypothetical protein [Paraburkholderia sp. DHOC27]|uniref:hypothetical protein n=1 Tax=Paraburkholderia sp. DHOC27 TaxID=2303330 RepID=UPI0026A12831